MFSLFARRTKKTPRPGCARPACTKPAQFAVTYPRGTVHELCSDCTLTSLGMALADGLELDVRPIGVKR